MYFPIYDNKASTFHGKPLLLREQNDTTFGEEDVNCLDSMIGDGIDQYVELIDIVDEIAEGGVVSIFIKKVQLKQKQTKLLQYQVPLNFEVQMIQLRKTID